MRQMIRGIGLTAAAVFAFAFFVVPAVAQQKFVTIGTGGVTGAIGCNQDVFVHVIGESREP